jgi:hypothetical protein
VPQAETRAVAPTGLGPEVSRWLPLAVPGFALLLIVCTMLIWKMAL